MEVNSTETHRGQRMHQDSVAREFGTEVLRANEAKVPI